MKLDQKLVHRAHILKEFIKPFRDLESFRAIKNRDTQTIAIVLATLDVPAIAKAIDELIKDR